MAQARKWLSIPQLTYSVDREFQWPWLPFLAYSFMLLVAAVLLPLNYALQGYEPLTTYKQDPNTTSPHWYHRFVGYPEPGSQCNPHIFNVGDTFQTSIGLFTYTLQSISYNTTRAYWDAYGGSAIPYHGLSLDWCDIVEVGLKAELQDSEVTLNGLVQCFHPDFQVLVHVTVPILQSNADAGIPESWSGQDYSPLMYLGAGAVPDLITQALNVPNALALTTLHAGTLAITPCPKIVVDDPNQINITQASVQAHVTNSPCLQDVYTEPPISATTITVDAQTFNSTDTTASDLMKNVANNVLEVMVAAVRFDLGNYLPNSFLANPTSVLSANQTFLPPYVKEVTPGQVVSTTALSASILISQINAGIQNRTLPLGPPHNELYPQLHDPTVIVTSYECHLTVEKPPGSAFISVVVATLSIGGSIWGTFILLATLIAKKSSPQANYCQYHSLETGERDSAAVHSALEYEDPDTIRDVPSHGSSHELKELVQPEPDRL